MWFDSEYLVIPNVLALQFQCLKPPSGLFKKGKLKAEGKQTAEFIKIFKYSLQTCLLWADSAFEASKWLIWKIKQTADYLKNPEFSFQTSLLWADSVFEAS